MAKNSFYNRMKQKERDQYREGVQGGMKMGLDLVVIALNHEFGFGEQRIARLENKVRELLDEIVDMNDPVVTRAHLDKALKQIRGDDYEVGYK